MREITEHIVNPANEHIRVFAVDEPGEGGASHEYLIEITPTQHPVFKVRISFQNGPIPEADVNGVTQEVLLAIVADRLRGFLRGKFPSRESALALTKIEEAQMWLQKRTRDRMARGVEGKHEL